jgi:aconitase A
MFLNLIHNYLVSIIKSLVRPLIVIVHSYFILLILTAQLPFCLRILLESTVRQYNNLSIGTKHIEQILHWQSNTSNTCELPFLPSRVIMHDFSYVKLAVRFINEAY